MKTLHWEESSGATVTVNYYYPKRSFVVIFVTIPQNARILLQNFLLRNFLNITVVVGLDLPLVCLSVLANGMNKINATYNKMSEMST